MRYLTSFFAALLFAAATCSSVVAADAPARKASTVKSAKAGAAKRNSGTATRLKPALVAPTTDILHEHFAVNVTGTITSPDGQPLAGATIWKTNTREILAVTNSQGDFSLTLPTNARVTLTCGYAGYGDQQLMLSQPQRQNQFVVSLERQK